jgi:hypothetical protein
MRRVAAASLAVVFGALGGCSGSDDSSGGEADADAHDGAIDTHAIDAAPETELDTAIDSASDVESEAEAEAAPTCTGEESEPNDTAPEAVPLGTIDDCDSSGSTLHGVLSTSSDVDYWHYQGRDTVLCTVDPTAKTGDSVNVCVFVACLHGATRVNGCSSGSTPMASQAGLHGCCFDGPGETTVDFTCTLVGSDDSADVYMRVEDPSASSCQRYDVDYHF